MSLTVEVRTHATGRKHHNKGGYQADEERRYQRLPELSTLHWLKVGAEHVDEPICVHVLLSRLTRTASARKPRWTETLIADSDTPHLAAASRTHNPSSFTY